jgi:transposase-like protein
MLKKQRKFTSAFKAKVVLELIKEKETIGQISSRYEIHPTQANKWKREVQAKIEQIFENTQKRELAEKNLLIEELYKQIGQLKVEMDWLKKKMGITE